MVLEVMYGLLDGSGLSVIEKMLLVLLLGFLCLNIIVV